MTHDSRNNYKSLKDAFEEGSNILQNCLEKIPNPDRKVDLENYVKSLFILRFRYNLKAISELQDKFQKDIYFKIPTFLILRTCLSDLLTYFYFLYIVKHNYPNTNKIESKIKGYLVDHLHRVKEDINSNYNEGKMDKSEYDHYCETIKSFFPDFLDSKGELIKKDFPSFKIIAKTLKKDSALSWITVAYDYYLYLSKFEHIGVLTNEFQEFHKIQNEYDNKGVLLSLAILVDGINVIVMSFKDPDITDRWVKFKEYLKSQ